LTKRLRTNLALSVHQLLMNKARDTHRPFNELLQYYAMERFLYRLSKSPYAGKFILKGALMFTAWKLESFRPTADIDLLGRADHQVANIVEIAKHVCAQAVEPDGLIFNSDSVTGARIAEDADYEGVRTRFRANLGSARITLQLDIGFGDVIVPAAQPIEYPAILDFPAPRLRGYNKGPKDGHRQGQEEQRHDESPGVGSPRHTNCQAGLRRSRRSFYRYSRRRSRPLIPATKGLASG
jgi:hypothetical protein